MNQYKKMKSILCNKEANNQLRKDLIFFNKYKVASNSSFSLT